MKLTEKQKRFIDYYLEIGNATEAARRAGYSEKTAPWIAQQNLQKLTIREQLEKRIKELNDKRVAKLAEVLEYLTTAMRGEIEEEVVVVEVMTDGTSEARIMNKQICARDRLKAAELLYKRYERMPELVAEEQRLRIEKMKAELSEMQGSNEQESMTFEFDRGNTNEG